MTTITTPTLSQYLSHEAIARLAQQYDVATIDAAWARGDYGTLHSSDTTEMLGAATREQAVLSYESWYEGHIETQLTGANRVSGIPLQRGMISVYVQP